jgi:hypothetical protein
MVHLSLSFDGWSSKGHDEIYTVHVTTPLRQSFLFDALVLTGLSTSGESLFNFLSEVGVIVSFYNQPQLTVLLDYYAVNSTSLFNCGLRHNCKCQKVPSAHLRKMAMDLELPRSLSSAELDDERHHVRL